MTERMSQDEARRLADKILAKASNVIQNIQPNKTSACIAVIEELKRDPKMRVAINKLENELIIDALLHVAPITKPFEYANHLAQQAHAKMERGDIDGGRITYAAAIAVGTVSLIPVLPTGDALIEYLRYRGIDLERSPLRQTVDTAMGAILECDNQNDRTLAATGKLNLSAQELAARHRNLTPDQQKSLDALIERLRISYEQVAHDTKTREHTPYATEFKGAPGINPQVRR